MTPSSGGAPASAMRPVPAHTPPESLVRFGRSARAPPRSPRASLGFGPAQLRRAIPEFLQQRRRLSALRRSQARRRPFHGALVIGERARDQLSPRRSEMHDARAAVLRIVPPLYHSFALQPVYRGRD